MGQSHSSNPSPAVPFSNMTIYQVSPYCQLYLLEDGRYRVTPQFRCFRNKTVCPVPHGTWKFQELYAGGEYGIFEFEQPMLQWGRPAEPVTQKWMIIDVVPSRPGRNHNGITNLTAQYIGGSGDPSWAEFPIYVNWDYRANWLHDATNSVGPFPNQYQAA